MDPIPMWQSIAIAPTDQDVEVAVIDRAGEHPLVFPCRRLADGWVSATTRQRIDIRPTHWRPWNPRPRDNCGEIAASPRLRQNQS
jgi:hypothetical protein